MEKRNCFLVNKMPTNKCEQNDGFRKALSWSSIDAAFKGKVL